MTTTRRLLGGFTGTALGVFVCGPAEALDRRVRIVNDSTHDIVEFYGSRVGGGPSQEDMLGETDLSPGGSIILSFEDGSGYCRFAFRAVFDDGLELERASVNVCEIGTYRYTDR